MNILKNIRTFIILSSLFFVFCALRDNRFDPQSPLFRSSPPTLNVNFSYDTTKILQQMQDTLVIRPPMTIEINTDAVDEYGNEVSVRFTHKLDTTVTDWSNGSQFNVDLSKSGLHTLQFDASDEDGRISSWNYYFRALPTVAPSIIEIKSDRTKLPLNSKIDVSFITSIIDSSHIVDSLYYVFFPFSIVRKHIEDIHHSDTIKDTTKQTFYSPADGPLWVEALIVDKDGRRDSSSVYMQFDRNTYVIKPSSIRIDSLWAETLEPKAGLPVTFQISLSGVGDNKLGYYWRFGDKSYTNESVPNPTHTYSKSGIFNVMLSIESDSTIVAIDSMKVDVAYRPPEIKLINVIPDTIYTYIPVEYYFWAEAYDQDGMVDSYTWKFGDSTADESYNNLYTPISHTYSKPGAYTVRLIVADDRNNTDTLTREIEVFEHPPITNLPRGGL